MKSITKELLYSVFGALILMSDAFINGFPIVYSDTSTYLASGFELLTPVDRPITYGLFIRAFSLNGFTLWLAVFFQALILSWLIFMVIKLIFGEEKLLRNGLMAIIFITFFTGISWTVSQLIPDVFTPIALLSCILILFGKYTKRTLIFLYFIYFLSVAMHISHLAVFSLLLCAVFIVKKFLFAEDVMKKIKIRIGIMFLLTVATLLIMSSAIAKSKNVFFMSAMVEHGIVKQYLDDNCGMKNYKLCAYKDSLPDKAYLFMWDETHSPFYKIGGWEGSKDEFSEIISATLTQPKYIRLHIKASVKATFQQFIHFDIGDGNGSFLAGTKLFERVQLYAPNDVSAYKNSMQNQAGFVLIEFKNTINKIVIILSLVILLFILIKYKKVFFGIIFPVAVITLLLIFFSSWDCGTFSCCADRFGCKIMWLIPFLTMIGLLWVVNKSKKVSTQNP